MQRLILYTPCLEGGSAACANARHRRGTTGATSFATTTRYYWGNKLRNNDEVLAQQASQQASQGEVKRSFGATRGETDRTALTPSARAMRSFCGRAWNVTTSLLLGMSLLAWHVTTRFSVAMSRFYSCICILPKQQRAREVTRQAGK